MSSRVPDGQDVPFAWRALQVGALCRGTWQPWGAGGGGLPVHRDTLNEEDKVPEEARGRTLVGGAWDLFFGPRDGWGLSDGSDSRIPKSE